MKKKILLVIGVFLCINFCLITNVNALDLTNVDITQQYLDDLLSNIPSELKIENKTNNLLEDVKEYLKDNYDDSERNILKINVVNNEINVFYEYDNNITTQKNISYSYVQNNQKIDSNQSLSAANKQGWYTNEIGTYYYENGVMLKGIHEIEGKTYHFGQLSGQLKKGWSSTTDWKYYYSNSNGEMQFGFVNIDGCTYYISRENGLYKGIHEIEGKQYHFGQLSGILKKGWSSTTDWKYYYSNDSGEMQFGFVEIDGETYYIDQTHGLYKNFFNINNKQYYSNNDGQMQFGFVNINGCTYYISEEEGIYKGIHEIEGKMYHFGQLSGILKKGWSSTTDWKYYYSNNNGEMQFGFVNIDGCIYYISKEDGLYKGIHEIEGKQYHFGQLSGILKKGWSSTTDWKYYYSNDNGEMQFGFVDIDGCTYYISNENGLYKGIHEIEGKMYHFGQLSGILKKGWSSTTDWKYYYSNDNGEMQFGFVNIDNSKYYISRENGLYRNSYIINGKQYYSDNNGKIQLGFVDINGCIYYISEEEGMYKGIHEIEGKTYHFGQKSGILKKGWSSAIDGKQYYSNNNGEMQFGFVDINGCIYYISKENGLYKGIHEIEGKKYHFGQLSGILKKGWSSTTDWKYYYSDNDGVIQTGVKTINGHLYRFDDNGVFCYGWQKLDGNMYYFYSDTNYAKSITIINDSKYEFSSTGILKNSNIKLVVDVSSHQKNIDWNTVINNKEIDGAIIRIGYGTSYVTDSPVQDSYFLRNINAINGTNFLYGTYLYSYAIDEVSAKIEANFVINTLSKNNVDKSKTIYYDLESNAWTQNLTSSDYDKIISTFINTLAASGYKAKVYTYKNLAETKFSDYAKSQLTWIAQYNDECNYNGTYNAWQYTSSASLSGISAKVDMSIFY